MLGKIALALDDAVVFNKKCLTLCVTLLGLEPLYYVEIAEGEEHGIGEEHEVEIVTGVFDSSTSPLHAHLSLLEMQEIFVFIECMVLE